MINKIMIILLYIPYQILVIIPYLSIAIITLISIQGIVYKVFKISLYNKIMEVKKCLIMK